MKLFLFVCLFVCPIVSPSTLAFVYSIKMTGLDWIFGICDLRFAIGALGISTEPSHRQNEVILINKMMDKSSIPTMGAIRKEIEIIVDVKSYWILFALLFVDWI